MTPTNEKARPVASTTAEPVLTNPSRGKAMNKMINNTVAGERATEMPVERVNRLCLELSEALNDWDADYEAVIKSTSKGGKLPIQLINRESDARPDYWKGLMMLEGHIYDLVQMTSIVNVLWQDHRSQATKDLPSRAEYSFFMLESELDRFDFALTNIENRTETLMFNWSNALKGKEVQPC